VARGNSVHAVRACGLSRVVPGRARRWALGVVQAGSIGGEGYSGWSPGNLPQLSQYLDSAAARVVRGEFLGRASRRLVGVVGRCRSDGSGDPRPF